MPLKNTIPLGTNTEREQIKGNAQSFPPNIFILAGMSFFNSRNLEKKGQTSNKEDYCQSCQTSRPNADNFLGDIWIRGSSPHVESLSTWRDGLRFSILDFWLFSAEIKQHQRRGQPHNLDKSPSTCTAHPYTPWQQRCNDAATIAIQVLPTRLCPSNGW